MTCKPGSVVNCSARRGSLSLLADAMLTLTQLSEVYTPLGW